MVKECIFCRIADGDIPNRRIYENDNFFSILDQNQDIKGHTLVISKKHFEVIFDLPSSLGQELLDCIKKTSMKIIEEYNAEGINVLQNNFEVAGQVVKHFHAHVIPRKKGDRIKVLG